LIFFLIVLALVLVVALPVGIVVFCVRKGDTRSRARAAVLPVRGAMVGAAAALMTTLGVGGLHLALTLASRVPIGASRWITLVSVPPLAATGGLVTGYLGALVGRRWVGASIGAIGFGAGSLLFVSDLAPSVAGTSIDIESEIVAACVLSGLASGFAGAHSKNRFEWQQGSQIEAGQRIKGGETMSRPSSSP
jgi:hypothetical protein